LDEETNGEEEWENVTDSEEESPSPCAISSRAIGSLLPKRVRKYIRDFVKVAPWLRLVAKLRKKALTEEFAKLRKKALTEEFRLLLLNTGATRATRLSKLPFRRIADAPTLN
jgi:hypothetical protein